MLEVNPFFSLSQLQLQIVILAILCFAKDAITLLHGFYVILVNYSFCALFVNLYHTYLLEFGTLRTCSKVGPERPNAININIYICHSQSST